MRWRAVSLSGPPPLRPVDVVLPGVDIRLTRIAHEPLDLVVGKPIKTSDERAGHPDLWSRRAQLSCRRTGGRPQPSHSPGPSRCPVYYADQRRHHPIADNRLLFLSPDHRRLSLRRRFPYRSALQSWPIRRPACGGCAPRGLYPHGRRGHFRGRGRAGFRRSVSAAAYGSIGGSLATRRKSASV